MKHHLSPLDRLIKLAAEAEQILARGISSHDIRQACALARGYLELARSYNEPLKTEDVERVLARIRSALAACPPETETKMTLPHLNRDPA